MAMTALKVSSIPTALPVSRGLRLRSVVRSVRRSIFDVVLVCVGVACAVCLSGDVRGDR